MIKNISSTSLPWYKEMLEEVSRDQIKKNWPSEKMFADMLDEYKIEYQRQVVINPFVVDFAIPSKNLIIEIDGYSHAKIKNQDKVRNRYLKKLGFRLMRYWAYDVKHNYLKLLNKIKEYSDGDKNLNNFFKSIKISEDDEIRVGLIERCSIKKVNTGEVGIARNKKSKGSGRRESKRKARQRDWAVKNKLAYPWKAPASRFDSFLVVAKQKMPYPYKERAGGPT